VVILRVRVEVILEVDDEDAGVYENTVRVCSGLGQT